MREITISDCCDCNHSIKRWRGRKINCFYSKSWVNSLIRESDRNIKECPIPAWCPIFLKQNPQEAAVNNPDDFLEGQQKPTVEQVAWVFAHLFEHMTEGGTFRYLMYSRMGLDKGAYVPLCKAGGMAISDAFFELEELQKAEACALADAAKEGE